jgi:hypothetical protein
MKKIISLSIFCLIFVTGLLAADAAMRTEVTKQKPVVGLSTTATPSIKVMEPKAGDAFSIGSSRTISWIYSNLTGTVRVLLYKGGIPTTTTPVLVSMIVDNTGKGAFNWPIHPDLAPGNNYTIVVESNDKPGIKGISASFSLIGKDAKPATSLVPGTLPKIQITQPTADTIWELGTSHTITWKAPADATGDINIKLLWRDHGIQTIVNNVPVKNGHFTFTIDKNQQGNPANDPQYRIDIVGATDPKLRGTSDFFSIPKPLKPVPPLPQVPVTLDVSLAQNSYDVGPISVSSFTIPIEWTYTGTPSNKVTISFQPIPFGDGTKPQNIIINPFEIATNVSIGTNGKGKYVWQVPAQLSADIKNQSGFKGISCKIRVTVIGNTDIFDEVSANIWWNDKH